MKYKLTDETKEWFGHILHRIEAEEDFGNVKAGDKGGWIEQEENLSQEDNCWVYGNARVCGDAYVSGNACVCGDACVSGNAWVRGYARVCGKATIESNADYICVQGMGSAYRVTTIYRGKNGLEVVCGCFHGNLDEFEARVKETHGDNKFAREYLALIGLAKIHFDLDKEGV